MVVSRHISERTRPVFALQGPVSGIVSRSKLRFSIAFYVQWKQYFEGIGKFNCVGYQSIFHNRAVIKNKVEFRNIRRISTNAQV
jgi:hypothetical protein